MVIALKSLLRTSVSATDVPLSTWTARASTSGIAWQTTVYGAGLFVTIGTTTQVQTSPDGITWTARTMPAPGAGAFRNLVYANGLFVVTGSGTNSYNTSPDGITWTARTLPTSGNWYSLAYGNGLWVTANYSSNIAYTSADAITWTSRSLPSTQTWYTLAYGNGTFVLLNNTGTAAATSPDGITWTARTLPSVTNAAWRNLTFGGGLFIALTGSNATTVSAITSPDGITWTQRSFPSTTVGWTGLGYGNGYWVATADQSTASAISPDGVNWTARTLPATAAWNQVAYANGTFVALSTNSTNAATAPGVPTVLYTAPASTSVVLTSIQVANLSGNPAVVTVSINGIAFVPGVSIANGGTYQYTGRQIITAGQQITGFADQRVTLNFTGVVIT